MVLRAESERSLFIKDRRPINYLLATTDTRMYAHLRTGLTHIGIELKDFGDERREEGIGGTVLLSSSSGDISVEIEGSPKVKFDATQSSLSDNTIEAEVPFGGAITILQNRRSIKVKHYI